MQKHQACLHVLLRCSLFSLFSSKGTAKSFQVEERKDAEGIIAEQQEGATRRYEVTSGTYAFEVN